MRYKQDIILGSIVIFANGEYLILFTVSQSMHFLTIYLLWASNKIKNKLKKVKLIKIIMGSKIMYLIRIY